LIVNELPTGPVFGVRLLIRGLTVKLLAVDPVPPFGVVTVISPVDPDAGTVAWMLVSESTVNVVATPPLKATELAPLKLRPVSSTDVPDTPLIGANELITGAGTKFVGLVPIPVVVVTVIGPIVALVGT
jgi:hypothetical protein